MPVVVELLVLLAWKLLGEGRGGSWSCFSLEEGVDVIVELLFCG